MNSYYLSQCRSRLYCVGVCILLLSLLAPSKSIEAFEQTKPIGQNEQSILPILTAYSPMPCVNPGGQVIISLGNTERYKPTAKTLDLIVESQGSQTRLIALFKNKQSISITVPELVANQPEFKIGLMSDKGWKKNALSITVCNPHRIQTRQNSAPQRTLQSDEQEMARKPIKESDKQPTKPAREQQTNADNEDLQRRIANRQADGSLIGSGLPSLPEELRLKKNNDTSSYVSNELVAVSADIDQAKQLAQIMSGYQARAIRRKTMKSLGMVLTTFRLAPGYNVTDMLEQLRTDNPDIWIDANHYYFPNRSSEKNQPKKHSVNPSRERLFANINYSINNQCSKNLKIGLLDGPVDITVESLATQSINQKNMFSRGKKAASSNHATAIASLIVGSNNFPGLTGIASQAELSVGVVMQKDPDDDKKSFSTTESLILGLNWLVEQKVNVINLSLGGPRNALLEIALMRVLSLDIGVVAAAGNGGSDSKESYPAAQSNVIAVSAVDNELNLAEDATQGEYIELAAPGVDLWVPYTQSKAHYLSGSSLAAPLVAVALAQLGGSVKQAEALFKASKDLGKPGKDPKYGWGLLQFPQCK